MARTSVPSRLPTAISLASYLDDMFSDYPVVTVEEGALVASYSRVEVKIRFETGCPDIRRVGRSTNRFTAPSLSSALEFITAVEAVRQSSAYPYLQFQTGWTPNSAGNDLRM